MRIVDLIGILLAGAGANGVEIVRHLPRRGHCDVRRELTVDRIGDAVDGDARVGAEIRNIDACVNARVRPAAASHVNRVADHARRSLFHGLPDGALGFLHLPTMVGRAVITQGQRNIPHRQSLLFIIRSSAA